MSQLRKVLHFWPVALTVFLADCASKSLAEDALRPYASHPVLGDFLRLTLVYNRSAAMSVDLGPLSRIVLSVIAFIALVGLWIWYRRTEPTAHLQIVALGLIWAGAAGNLWDRLRHPLGVVDFIDVGVAGWRFWVFNVADVAVFTGALLLLATTFHSQRRESAT